MPGRKGNKKGKQPAQQSRRPRKKRPALTPNQLRVMGAMDAGAKSFARMLLDPCNAPMCPSTYAGMGTGEFRRYRRILNVPATAVEGSYIITPGANILNWGSHVAANRGTPYQYSNQETIFSSIPADTETRCLAACVKVRYTGAEQSRQGTIGLRTLPFRFLEAGSTSSAAIDMENCPQINRCGEVTHEVKFVPGTADELFTSVAGTPVIDNLKNLGSFGFVFSGINAGTLQIEITAIIEIEAPAGIVPVATTPPSKNTTNQVLSFLGPVAKWAFNTYAVPTIKSGLSAAMQSLTTTDAVSAGAMMLTL